MPSGNKAAAFALFVATGLAGCATAPPPPSPIVDLGTRQCPSVPDLAHPLALAFDPKEEKETTTPIGADTPCLQGDAGNSLYVVYVFPDTSVPYTVTVASNLLGGTMFAPRVVLYGEDGTPRRTFAGQDIVFRGTALSVLFRVHADERYLVVESDPRIVGRTSSEIREATMTRGATAYGRGYAIYYQIHTGSDTTLGFTYAHNGSLTVTLTPLPAK
jgi:hypothetical protein